jgi:hypothetical protein
VGLPFFPSHQSKTSEQTQSMGFEDIHQPKLNDVF